MTEGLPPANVVNSGGHTPGQGRLEGVRRLARSALPLSVRKALARLLGRQKWFAGRSWWAHELLRDFADADPSAYHRFLWAHHLGYAETYEVDVRFGNAGIHPTRHLLFDDLASCLSSINVAPETVSSVLEIGCSLGYNLRFLETGLFPRATKLEGFDIDAYAIDRGNDYLGANGSRVRLFRTDAGDFERQLGGQSYDVTLCAGVLMYLPIDEAARVTAAVLRRTNTVAVFAGLADPIVDNGTLNGSGVRSRDGTFIHNIDAMVASAGGRVLRRRWEGARLVEGNSVYFVFAAPGTP